MLFQLVGPPSVTTFYMHTHIPLLFRLDQLASLYSWSRDAYPKDKHTFLFSFMKDLDINRFWDMSKYCNANLFKKRSQRLRVTTK